MKNLLLLSVFVTSVSSAQYAVTYNRSTDVRESGSATAFVSYRLPAGTPVYTFEDEAGTGWTPIDFNQEWLKIYNLSGFVRKGDVKPISEFTPIPYSYSNENKMILKKDDISVILTQVDFDKSTSVFEFVKENPTVLLKINGKEFFGTDGGMPTKRYGFIDVTIGKDKISIPQADLEDLFQPNLEDTQAFYDPKNDILYISSMNSDGAGGYSVLWIIEKRQYKTRHVFYGF
jgi:hypothetical protein